MTEKKEWNKLSGTIERWADEDRIHKFKRGRGSRGVKINGTWYSIVTKIEALKAADQSFPPDSDVEFMGCVNSKGYYDIKEGTLKKIAQGTAKPESPLPQSTKTNQESASPKEGVPKANGNGGNGKDGYWNKREEREIQREKREIIRQEHIGRMAALNTAIEIQRMFVEKKIDNPNDIIDRAKNMAEKTIIPWIMKSNSQIGKKVSSEKKLGVAEKAQEGPSPSL